MSKIMLVEDDPVIIRLYTKVLELNGFSVEKAENGLEALEKLPQFKPDLILLDIMMPELNGIQFLEKINAGTQEGSVPVIVLTNVVDPDIKTQAAAAGASLVVVKSETEPDDIVAAVNQVLNKEILQVESLEPAESEVTDDGSQPN
jgi:CheY-like chemotaxis protein